MKKILLNNLIIDIYKKMKNKEIDKSNKVNNYMKINDFGKENNKNKKKEQILIGSKLKTHNKNLNSNKSIDIQLNFLSTNNSFIYNNYNKTINNDDINNIRKDVYLTSKKDNEFINKSRNLTKNFSYKCLF